MRTSSDKESLGTAAILYWDATYCKELGGNTGDPSPPGKFPLVGSVPGGRNNPRNAIIRLKVARKRNKRSLMFAKACGAKAAKLFTTGVMSYNELL